MGAHPVWVIGPRHAHPDEAVHAGRTNGHGAATGSVLVSRHQYLNIHRLGSYRQINSGRGVLYVDTAPPGIRFPLECGLRVTCGWTVQNDMFAVQNDTKSTSDSVHKLNK